MTSTVSPTFSESNFLETIRSILKDTEICMLCTIGSNSEIYSRPMALQATEFDGDLWFFSSRDSAKAQQMEANPAVTVTATNNKQCVVLQGRGRFVEDRKKMEEFWKPAYQVWFPEGLDDPKLILLYVDVHHAEYWDWRSGVFSHMLSLIKSLATGETPSTGTHEERSL